MPLFGKRPAGLSEEQQAAAEVDLQRIREGGIPLAAQERLRGAESSGTPFSSDLSAKEYALAHASGLQPIAQVMGSSVVQLGWAAQRGLTGGALRFGGIQEAPELAEPWNLCRQRAFDRIDHEARAARADAVIGIELRMTPFMDDPGQVELAVFGTAVRETTLAVNDGGRGGPRLSALSGQDVDKLRRIGAETAGMIGHTAVVGVALSPMGNRAMGSWWGNQEMVEVSEAVSYARRLALAEVERQGRAVHANDMVVSTLRHTILHHEYDNGGYTQHYFIVTMHVLATAIRLGAHEPHPGPLSGPTMSISLGA